MNQPKWSCTKTPFGIVIKDGAGKPVATVHQEEYALKIAVVPELYEALDRLTDVTACPSNDPYWWKDLGVETVRALDAIARALGAWSNERIGPVGPRERQK